MMRPMVRPRRKGGARRGRRWRPRALRRCSTVTRAVDRRPHESERIGRTARQSPLCPDSDQIPHRTEMARRATAEEASFIRSSANAATVRSMPNLAPCWLTGRQSIQSSAVQLSASNLFWGREFWNHCSGGRVPIPWAMFIWRRAWKKRLQDYWERWLRSAR